MEILATIIGTLFGLISGLGLIASPLVYIFTIFILCKKLFGKDNKPPNKLIDVSLFIFNIIAIMGTTLLSFGFVAMGMGNSSGDYMFIPIIIMLITNLIPLIMVILSFVNLFLKAK